MTHPFLMSIARDMAVVIEHPVLGPSTQVGLPFELSATPASIRTAPPLLGEHGEEVLGQAGYSADEIARLRADGVI